MRGVKTAAQANATRANHVADATRINHVARAIAENRRAIGFHMIFPSPEIIDILGREGFEFVYLDTEHGSFDLHDINAACRAAELCGITVLARVPHHDPTVIARYLDHGVQGIIIPHVSSAQQARQAVEACFYLPKGRRPYARARINGYRTDIADFPAHFAAENDNITLTVQLEDVGAIANLDEILDVGGIDYFTIGKQDLALSMGILRHANDTPEEVSRMIERVERALAQRGLLSRDDVMILGRVCDFLVSGARAMVNKAGTP